MLGLSFREQLPPIVAAELDSLITRLQRLLDTTTTSGAVDARVTALISTVASLSSAIAALQAEDIVLLAAIAATNALLASSTYTPALTNVTNITASTAYSCQYLRVGTSVTVSGKVDVDPTLAGQVQLRIALPVASNLANANELGGVAASPGIAGQSGAIYADAVNNAAILEWIAVDLTNQAWYFSFTYRVI